MTPRQVILSDGRRLGIRPICPDDEPVLRAHFAALSERSRYQRFHQAVRELSDETFSELVHPDNRRHVGIVACEGDRLIATARFFVDPSGRAEMAMAVLDDWQGRGLGAYLMAALIECAQALGLGALQAYVLASNSAMLKVLDRCGWPTTIRREGDTVVVTVHLGDPPFVPGDGTSSNATNVNHGKLKSESTKT